MKQHATSTIIGVGIFTLVAVLFIPVVDAMAIQTGQQEESGQALEIAPPVLNLTGNPGQVLKTQISLRDVSSGALLVTGEVNDFTASGEDGTPKIIMEEGEPNPYSLKSWIAPLPQLLLQPRQIENLPVTIRIPADAAPGGYYGVVRFTASAPELDGQGVSLSASLGALILLRVNGDVKEDLAIEEFSVATPGGTVKSMFETTPLVFAQRIKNNGNIHEQPVGQVVISDMFGKKIAGVNVNLERRNILPQTTRKFEQTLDKSVLGNKKLFGKYTATLTLTYGDKKQTVTTTKIFWVIPYTLIGSGIIILIGGFLALRFMIKRYNSHIINQATKSKAKSKTKSKK
ncbi:MAG: hypothetical protein JWM07_419 [Candidatus Saccharibacteria bacterium]|jgi:hypothetical protein|nr:hypothetical protein [Candidatus Saccharibacteria bacterium]